MVNSVSANESTNSGKGHGCPTLRFKSNLVTADRIDPIQYFEDQSCHLFLNSWSSTLASKSVSPRICHLFILISWLCFCLFSPLWNSGHFFVEIIHMLNFVTIFLEYFLYCLFISLIHREFSFDISYRSPISPSDESNLLLNPFQPSSLFQF